MKIMTCIELIKIIKRKKQNHKKKSQKIKIKKKTH